jgi:hypothetical protein
MNNSPVGIDPQSAKTVNGKTPYNIESFTQMKVIDVWEKYEEVLSWGRGQTLAILDDGCDLSQPQWQVQLPWGPKVIATHNTVEGGSNPAHRPPGYHGTTVGNPSSYNYDDILGVAYNNQVAHVRCITVVHLPKREDHTIAAALQWVIDHHEKYRITAVNLAAVYDIPHAQHTPSQIDEKLMLLKDKNIWVSAPCGNSGFTNGISWPASANDCFAIGATIPGKQEVYLNRYVNTDLLAPAKATSSSNAYAAACSMILREAIEKSTFDWHQLADNFPDAMMKIFQQTGNVIIDHEAGYEFQELNLLAAVDFVFLPNKHRRFGNF